MLDDYFGIRKHFFNERSEIKTAGNRIYQTPPRSVAASLSIRRGIKSVLPSGESIWVYILLCRLQNRANYGKTWRRPQNRKHIRVTYCNAARGRPRHGHWQHVSCIKTSTNRRCRLLLIFSACLFNILLTMLCGMWGLSCAWLRTWRDVVQEDCEARKLNRGDAMDPSTSRWRKLIKNGWWSW